MKTGSTKNVKVAAVDFVSFFFCGYVIIGLLFNIRGFHQLRQISDAAEAFGLVGQKNSPLYIFRVAQGLMNGGFRVDNIIRTLINSINLGNWGLLFYTLFLAVGAKYDRHFKNNFISMLSIILLYLCCLTVASFGVGALLKATNDLDILILLHKIATCGKAAALALLVIVVIIIIRRLLTVITDARKTVL